MCEHWSGVGAWPTRPAPIGHPRVTAHGIIQEHIVDLCKMSVL